MLPDYPELKKKFVKGLNLYLRKLVKDDPLFSQIKEEFHHEGNRISGFSEDGFTENSGYQEVSIDYSLKREDIIAKGPAVFVENILNVAEKMREEKAKLVIKKLNDVTEQTGCKVDGKPFNFDTFIEALEKIHIDFDDEGNPSLPTIIVNPQLSAILKEELPKWHSNPECERRMKELLDRKKKEWDDRESHRKLVD